MFKYLVLLGLLAGCSGHNKYGECVGFDDSDRDPTLNYKISVRNTVVSAIFFQTLFAPVLYVTSYAYCPTGKK